MNIYKIKDLEERYNLKYHKVYSYIKSIQSTDPLVVNKYMFLEEGSYRFTDEALVVFDKHFNYIPEKSAKDRGKEEAAGDNNRSDDKVVEALNNILAEIRELKTSLSTLTEMVRSAEYEVTARHK